MMDTTLNEQSYIGRVSIARVSRWVEGGNTSLIGSLPRSAYLSVLRLDDLRLLLNRTYNVKLEPKVLFKGNSLVKNVKQFCGELLDRCTRNHWKATIRLSNLDLRTRVSIASSLFSLRKLLPGDKPSVRDYIDKMSRPQQPLDPEFMIHCSQIIAREFPIGWDRSYWSHVRSFTPSTKSNLDKKTKGTYRCRAVDGEASFSRDAFFRWAGGTCTEPIGREVEAKAVLTGGKWRVITLSDPRLGNLLPLHHTIYSFLTKKKWLLRGEAKPDAFSEFGRIKGEVFVSGDYEGATDNLNQHATKLVLDLLLRRATHIPMRVREEARLCLSPLLRTRGPGYSGLSAVQRGQLMGSPLSFPLLCLINYLTFRYAVKREVPVKINGDDIVFRCLPSEADDWFGSVKASGLVVSKGKTLVSKSFFSLNSSYFHALDRGAGSIPHFRLSCLYKKCEDMRALAGRVAQIKRDLPVGEIRCMALRVLLRENLKLIYSSQGSFSRRFLCPIPKTVLRSLRLSDRESFYRSLPSEPERLGRILGFQQEVVPENWTKEKVVYRGDRRVPDEEVRDTMVSASWTGRILPETKDNYFARLRQNTFRYVAFCPKTLRMWAKFIGRLRAKGACLASHYSTIYTAKSYPRFPSQEGKFWCEKIVCEGPVRPVAFRRAE